MNVVKYEVIIPEEEGIEDFQVTGDNIGLFRVFDLEGNDISGQCGYIIIYMSGNAMLGLGTELIRLAHNFEEGKEVTIEPITENEAKQSMGMYLTPDSCLLTIVAKSFEPIEKYLEKYSEGDGQ